MPQMRTIIIAGAVAQKPLHGGHTWVFLQYLLGFKKLGWNVLLLDRLEPHDTTGFAFLQRLFDSIGLQDCFCILVDGHEPMGMSRSDLFNRIKNAALLLNVMGFLRDPELLAAAPLSAYLDIDPGFPQMWKATGLHDSLAGHHAFVTIGQHIGQEDCLIPTCGLDWITTVPPIVLDQWPNAPYDGGAITSVASWRGAYGPVDYQGKTFGLRVHEFRKFLQLPSLLQQPHPPIELALDIHSAEARDIDALKSAGWILSDPKVVASDIHSYRDYIAHSSAEFCVAKNMYVQAKTGWFSDRSACYLASGKPVIAQNTVWSHYLPSGEGLLSYSTVEQAAAAVESLCKAPKKHTLAARAIAADYFDSNRVLSKLLVELGID